MQCFDVKTEILSKHNIGFLNKTGSSFSKFIYIAGEHILRNENGKFFVMDLDGQNSRPWGE